MSIMFQFCYLGSCVLQISNAAISSISSPRVSSPAQFQASVCVQMYIIQSLKIEVDCFRIIFLFCCSFSSSFCQTLYHYSNMYICSVSGHCDFDKNCRYSHLTEDGKQKLRDRSESQFDIPCAFNTFP